MGVSFDEQETTINICRLDDEAEIWTSDSQMMAKLHRLGDENPDEWYLKETGMFEGNVVSETWRCPKCLIKFRAKKNTRVLTEEEREAARARLELARQARKP